jgi:hypothetical protein
MEDVRPAYAVLERGGLLRRLHGTHCAVPLLARDRAAELVILKPAYASQEGRRPDGARLELKAHGSLEGTIDPHDPIWARFLVDGRAA